MTADEHAAIVKLDLDPRRDNIRPFAVFGVTCDDFFMDDSRLWSETDWVCIHPIVDCYATDDGRFVVVTPEDAYDVTEAVSSAMAIEVPR